MHLNLEQHTKCQSLKLEICCMQNFMHGKKQFWSSGWYKIFPCVVAQQELCNLNILFFLCLSIFLSIVFSLVLMHLDAWLCTGLSIFLFCFLGISSQNWYKIHLLSAYTHFYSFFVHLFFFMSFPLAFRLCRHRFALLQETEVHFLCKLCNHWFCLFGNKERLESSSREKEVLI